MSNPYLPNWEYIPDGEPRVFGDRIYVYGSHDRPDSEEFCDYKLKVWSAPVDDPGRWTCHGDAFRTRADEEHASDVDWTDNLLFAPDVVYNNGKYYLFAYIVGAKGCVAVSDRPEGPFKLIGQYRYNIDNHFDQGTFIDPGVLVDDDGRVYIYCGFQGSYLCELDGETMVDVLDGTYQLDFLPSDGEDGFFEAASPRKVGDTYYIIYSPNRGSRLAYATSPTPIGPFTYRGYIVDNGVDYPGGNDHGSICKIKDQWYIFYHRMTNGSIMSRRGCVEKIYFNEDGSITPVEMTSLGFEESLNPFEYTPADNVCYLTGSGRVCELDPFTLVVTDIKNGTCLGYKYFDFGEDYNPDNVLRFFMKVRPQGASGVVHIFADAPDEAHEIGTVAFNRCDTIYTTKTKLLTGRHAIYLRVEDNYKSWAKDEFEGRNLFDLVSFVFMK